MGYRAVTEIFVARVNVGGLQCSSANTAFCGVGPGGCVRVPGVLLRRSSRKFGSFFVLAPLIHLGEFSELSLTGMYAGALRRMPHKGTRRVSVRETQDRGAFRHQGAEQGEPRDARPDTPPELRTGRAAPDRESGSARNNVVEKGRGESLNTPRGVTPPGRGLSMRTNRAVRTDSFNKRYRE